MLAKVKSPQLKSFGCCVDGTTFTLFIPIDCKSAINPKLLPFNESRISALTLPFSLVSFTCNQCVGSPYAIFNTLPLPLMKFVVTS